MNRTHRTPRKTVLASLALVVLALGAGTAFAAVQYLNDGAMQNASGGWDLPDKGMCYPDNSITTRSECVATQFTATYPDSTTCVAALGSWVTAADSRQTFNCIDGTKTLATCVDDAPSATWPAGIDRKWTNGVCALTMKGYDRNKVVCANQGGTYTLADGMCIGAWIMPNAESYTPPLLNRTGFNPSTGDQCLRCHRADTQWNSTRIRDVDSFVMTGHKNMARKVDPSTHNPWAGPGGTIYPTDSSGNPFVWSGGQITIGGNPTQAFWLYDGWLEDPHLPTVIYNAGSNGTTGKPLMSYSCARCHTTGWTSDATVNTAKEPEKSFSGITWDGTTLGTTGKVNLAGGVSGDTNKYGSWDLFGITCTRCHGTVVDNATTFPYSAPSGYSTHNNGFTGADSGSGYCSVAGPTNTAACTAAGGTWLKTSCSDGASTTQAACVAAGKVWSFSSCSANNPASTFGTVGGVPQAYCSTPSATYTSKAACTAVVGGAWTDVTSAYGTLAACSGAGWNWDGTSKCFACYVPNATYTTAAACAAVNINPLSVTWTNAFASDTYSCIDAGGEYTGTKTQRGQIITATCMGCHRQEASGLPYGATNVTSTYGTQAACAAAGKTWTSQAGPAAFPNSSAICVDYGSTDPGQQEKVGPYHNTITFPSHFHGNQYLNSPHGKFTSTFDKIATGKFNYAGTGEYKSHFMADGESLNTGNGCTGCHNVHKSVVEAANPAGGGVKECTECHAKNLALLQHPSGIGTPLEKPAEACAVCHMPEGLHFFRINASASYSTFPASAFTTTSVVNANTAPDGNMTNAVWVDLDMACGQCHGGGNGNLTTSGTIAAGSAALSVATGQGVNFAMGDRVTISGAGSAVGQPADFPTYVQSVAGDVVTLVGKATLAVTNAQVVKNPTANGAAYFSKAQLETYARGMHNDAPAAAFSYSYGNPNTLILNVDASSSTCSGSNANCNAYDWDWNDGSAHGSGKTASHTYLAGGTYNVTLTVTQYGMMPGTKTAIINIYAPDNSPTLSSTCTFDPNSWTATVVDGSSDPQGVKQVAVLWGDGSVVSSQTIASPSPGTPTGLTFTHTYIVPAQPLSAPVPFKITEKVYDTLGQRTQQVLTCTPAVAPAYFTIGGTVRTSLADGSKAVNLAFVQVKNAANKVVGQAYTNISGTYLVKYLKPGTYTVVVTKAGYTFPAPASVPVGPNGTNDVVAVTP